MKANVAVIPQVQVQTWGGRRVLSNDDIARVHHVSRDRVIKAFQRHSDELVEGEDYFNLNRSQLAVYRGENGLDNLSTTEKKANGLRVFTESGYLVMACTFRGPEAALIRRMLVKSYFKVKEDAQQTSQMNELIVSLQSTIANQNKVLLALNESLDRVFATDAPAAIPAAKEEAPANPYELQKGEATTAFLAERCKWYSTQNKPHVMFTEHVLRTLGIHTNKSTEYNTECSRCVIKEVDGVVTPRLYIKPAGIQKLLDWCEKTDYARSLKKVERYQTNFGVHKAGDIKSVYYLLETNGVKGVCRADKKRYNLKEF